MQDIIEYQGRFWKKITKNDWKDLPGKDILYCEGRAPIGYHKIDRIEYLWNDGPSVRFYYDGQTAWGSSNGSTSLDNSLKVRTYYIETLNFDSTKCHCDGPVFNRFCFDTQKVEPICAKCRRRKCV